MSAATTATGTEAVRAAATAQAGLSSAPASIPTKKSPKPRAATTASPAPAAMRSVPAFDGSQDRDTMPATTRTTPSHCAADGVIPRAGIDRERYDRRRRGDRCDDPHRPERESTVESREPDERRDAADARRCEITEARNRVSREQHPRVHAEQADDLRDDENREDGEAT